MYPTSPNPRAEYARRMNRVLDHIDRHLDAPLDLAQLADLANLSRFHFHRLFAAWMGETLGDYLRRRRMEMAAFRLSFSEASVLATALSTGFGSGEAFARAFKLHFGCTPTAWRDGAADRRADYMAVMRADSNPDQALRNPDQAGQGALGDHALSNQPPGETNMEVKIIDLPAARVAYLRYIGPYGPPLGEFWRKSVDPWIQAHGFEGNIRYGVGHDDPSITPPDKCRYDACVEVPQGFQPGGQASIFELPGGRYAVAQFRGPVTTIGEAWRTLCGEWLPSSGLQFDERPCFERYLPGSGADPETGVFSCELCIPVRAL